MVKSEALHERVEVLLDKWGIKPNKYLKFVFFLWVIYLVNAIFVLRNEAQFEWIQILTQ